MGATDNHRKRKMIKHYVAVYHLHEHFFDAEERHSSSVSKGAKELVSKLGLKTSRKERQKIIVTVAELTIVNGQVKRGPFQGVEVPLPIAQMTHEEFNQEITEVLKDLPLAFQPFVRNHIVDHEYTYEVAIEKAQEMVAGLMPAINEFSELFVSEMKIPKLVQWANSPSGNVP